MKNLLLIVCLLLSSIQICAQGSPPNDQQEHSSIKLKTVSRSTFSMKCIESWRLDESGTNGTTFMLFAPVEANDVFQENINYLVQDISAYNLNLDSYTEMSIGQLDQFLKNAKLLVNERVQKNGQACHHLVYEGIINGVDTPLCFEQYYWVIGTKAHLLTFTSEKTAFERYKVRAHKMMESFRLKIGNDR